MSEAKTEEVEAKPKSPVLKIIILVVVVILLMVLAIGGTLFATGMFAKKDKPDAEMVLDEGANAKGHDAPAAGGHGDAKGAHGDAKGGHGEAKGGHGDDKKGGTPGGTPNKKAVPADANAPFEKSYMELDEKKALVANVSGSRKVMQVNLSLMTTYDDRVFKNVEKHRAALRSSVLDVLRLVTEADLAKPDFRAELAVKLRERINSELERLERFGGIEEVFFSEFVYQ
jgi:flagellar protein FliL